MKTMGNQPHSKRRITAVFLFVICLCFVFSAGYAPAEVAAETNGGREPIDHSAELVEIMNLNLRYILNTRWPSEKDYVYAAATSMNSDQQLTEERRAAIRDSARAFADWRDVDEFPILYLSREQAENGIRPVSHAIYCIALALHYGYYDEEIAGVSGEDAEAMCIKLINSVVEEHRSNHPDDQEDRYWGDSWQSPLWAENIGLGAWLLRDSMKPEDYAKAERMVLNEADRMAYDFEIPYYQDENGKIIYPGDTKGEEIAWSAKILALACAMFPDSEKLPDWSDKLERMLVSSTAMQEDLGSERIVDGRKVGDLINGSNVNEDGTVVNHDLVHIDYMATIYEEMGDTIVVYKIAGEPVPEAATFNLDKIYRGLIDVDLGKYDESRAGKNFYLRDENGQPTGEVTMPGKNDWGKPGYAIYYLCDVMTDRLDLDTDIEETCKAHVWEELHYEKMRDQVRRETDGGITGQFFQPGENSFVSGELFMMHNLAEAYVLQR